jgi:hypothetical protein
MKLEKKLDTRVRTYAFDTEESQMKDNFICTLFFCKLRLRFPQSRKESEWLYLFIIVLFFSI